MRRFELNDIITYPVKQKRQISKKQRAALARGRGLRMQKHLNIYAAEAEAKFHDPNAKFNRRKYINRVRYVSEAEGISLKEAHIELMHMSPYITAPENYAYQIQRAVNSDPALRAKLRKLISEGTGEKYINTSIDWSQFTYDTPSGALVATFGSKTINIKIVSGQHSEDPNFIEIY